MSPSSTKDPPVAEGWFSVRLQVPVDAAEAVAAFSQVGEWPWSTAAVTASGWR